MFATGHLSSAAGGFAAAVAGLAAAVASRRQDPVHIVGIRDSMAPTGWQDWQAPGVRIHALDQLGPRSVGWTPALPGVLKTLRPDILHTHGLWMYPSLASLGWHRRTRRPHLITPHGMLDPWALGRSGVKKRLVSLLFEGGHLRQAACLHALNLAEAKAIRSYGLTNPVCIVPNGVDLPDPAPVDDRTGSAKTLLFLGRLDPKKGVRELLLAWRTLAGEARREGWRLQVTGWGEEPYVGEIRTLASALELDGEVLFTGPLFGSEKEQALGSATAFVLPSFSEGLPIAVLEAWAHRLPVVMSAKCNLPEGFAQGAAIETGTTPAAIADAVRRLFGATRTELAGMGHNGRRLVEARFTWERVGCAMTAVHRWILGGGNPPPDVVMA